MLSSYKVKVASKSYPAASESSSDFSDEDSYSLSSSSSSKKIKKIKAIKKPKPATDATPEKKNNKNSKTKKRKYEDTPQKATPNKKRRKTQKKQKRHLEKKKATKKITGKKKKRAPRKANSFHTENLIRLMRAAKSPAKRAIFANYTNTSVKFEKNILYTPTKKHTTELLTPSRFEYSTPSKGAQSRYASTPTNNSKFLPSRIIECDDGRMTLFLPEDKVSKTALVIPTKAKSWMKKSPIPKADMDGMIDIKITKKKIKKVDALSRKRKRAGQNPRKISQNKVMGNIGATQAMRKAGIKAPDGIGQHVHFIGFSLIGDPGQTVKNIGIGTRFANAAMELVNPAIKRLLYQKKFALPAVYVSAIPEWVPGFENIRLLDKLTLIIKDAPGDTFTRLAKVKFDMLSTASICVTEVLPIKNFIMAKFSTDPTQAPAPVKQNLVNQDPVKQLTQDSSPSSPSFQDVKNKKKKNPASFTPAFHMTLRSTAVKRKNEKLLDQIASTRLSLNFN